MPLPDVQGINISALPGGMDPESAAGQRRINNSEWSEGYQDGVSGRKAKPAPSDPEFLNGYRQYSTGYQEGIEEFLHKGEVPVNKAREFLGLPPEKDEVNHPGHYTSGSIEVWDFIVDQNLDYLRGNVIKYVSRAGKKDPSKELQDLEKAQAYLNKAIEVYKEMMNSDPLEERSSSSA